MSKIREQLAEHLVNVRCEMLNENNLTKAKKLYTKLYSLSGSERKQKFMSGLSDEERVLWSSYGELAVVDDGIRQVNSFIKNGKRAPYKKQSNYNIYRMDSKTPEELKKELEELLKSKKSLENDIRRGGTKTAKELIAALKSLGR